MTETYAITLDRYGRGYLLLDGRYYCARGEPHGTAWVEVQR